MRLKSAALVLCAMAVSAVPAASEAAPLLRYVGDCLERLERQWGNRPYTTAVGWNITSVTRDSSLAFQITPRAPQRVTTVASCDSDCNTMRLQIRDYRNEVVVAADGYGGVAEVSFDPVPGQAYSVVVQPLDCRESHCYIAWKSVS